MSNVIKLDNHRLLCGDATSKEDVDNLLDGAKVDLLLTDPPYGIDIVNPVGGGRVQERERERANGKVGPGYKYPSEQFKRKGKPRHYRAKTL